MASIDVSIGYFDKGKKFATVEIESQLGPTIRVFGTLYPKDVQLMFDIVEVVKKHRSSYPVDAARVKELELENGPP